MTVNVKYGYFRALKDSNDKKPTIVTVAFQESQNKTLPQGVNGKFFDVAFGFAEPYSYGYDHYGRFERGAQFKKKTGRDVASGRLREKKSHTFFVPDLDARETFLTLWSLFDSAINADGVFFPETVRRAHKRDQIRFGLNTARDIAEDQ